MSPRFRMISPFELTAPSPAPGMVLAEEVQMLPDACNLSCKYKYSGRRIYFNNVSFRVFFFFFFPVVNIGLLLCVLARKLILRVPIQN